MNDLEISIVKDTASPAVVELVKALASQALLRHVGAAATEFTKGRILEQPDNKQGWPSQDFYGKAARGTSYTTTQDGVRILVDNPDAPGAMKHAYNRGEAGKIYIYANGKLLSVPARAEFYGHKAGEFDNLKFVPFKSGARALVIGDAGTVRIGKRGGSVTKGTGARSAAMVAYWLVDSVEQDARPTMIPSKDEYIVVIEAAVWDGLAQLTGGRN